MLKQLRQLHISLAAKCQILFGAAVVLIIAAALFVPWQRMEQLTEHLNEKAAAAVARTVLGQHIAQHRAEAQGVARALPATTGPDKPEPVTIEGDTFHPPRIVPVGLASQPELLTRFENSAMARFQKDRKLPFFARSYANRGGREQGYRYALPLYATGECRECHAGPADAPASADARSALMLATTAPATQPAPLLGLLSIDIPSQISMSQRLLNQVFILTAGLIAGALAISVFYLVTTRLILEPVRVLQQTAQKVSEGDLNIRSDINTGDEFQVLSETFNTMLTNLKAGADQLRAVNKSLDLKLGQLAESNVALFESNRLKSEFLANVSHELRTPLNSILGFADLLKELTEAGSDQKASRYIQNILTAGRNLLELINDLLDLAKIEAGKMEVRSEPISMSDLFEALTGVLKPLSEAKSVTIVPTVAPEVPIVRTDPAKLQQILYNFLSNAIKFSPQGERIDLRAELDGQRVKLSVTDRGPGIDAAKQPMIFEKFRQLDGSVTREHGGTGLGLAISKELSVLLGGSIGVQSTAGQGATFHILLPLQIEAGAQDLRGRLVLT